MSSQLPSVMETARNPLAFNIRRQIDVFISKLPAGSPHAAALHTVTSTRGLLDLLSRLLVIPSLTLPISSLFRPILLDLCARLLHDQTNLENKFIALCLLVQPHIEIFP